MLMRSCPIVAQRTLGMFVIEEHDREITRLRDELAAPQGRAPREWSRASPDRQPAARERAPETAVGGRAPGETPASRSFRPGPGAGPWRPSGTAARCALWPAGGVVARRTLTRSCIVRHATRGRPTRRWASRSATLPCSRRMRRPRRTTGITSSDSPRPAKPGSKRTEGRRWDEPGTQPREPQPTCDRIDSFATRPIVT